MEIKPKFSLENLLFSAPGKRLDFEKIYLEDENVESLW